MDPHIFMLAAGAPFVTDIQNTVTAASGWISGLAIAGGGSMMAYHGLARNFETDPSKVAQHTQSMKKVIVGTAIVGGSTGIVAMFGKFFGLK